MGQPGRHWTVELALKLLSGTSGAQVFDGMAQEPNQPLGQ